MLKASHLSPGRLMSLWKHGFNEKYFTIGLSEHEVTPMVSGNIADIFSLWISHFLGLWFRDHLQWWTNSLFLKEDTPSGAQLSLRSQKLPLWVGVLSSVIHRHWFVASGRVKTPHYITFHSWKQCWYF